MKKDKKVKKINFTLVDVIKSYYMQIITIFIALFVFCIASIFNFYPILMFFVGLGIGFIISNGIVKYRDKIYLLTKRFK